MGKERKTAAGAVGLMLWLLFVYIMTYQLLWVALKGLSVDPCVVQAMSSGAVIWHYFKKDKKKGIDCWRESGFTAFGLTVKDILILAALGAGLNCLVGGIINLLPVSQEVAASYREMSEAPVMGVNPILAFAVITFLAPFLEEAFFRGIVLRKVAQRMNPLSALVMVSLAFDILHGHILWVIYASILGLVLGLAYLLNGSIYPSIIIHISFNLVSGIPMLLDPAGLAYRLTYGNSIFLVLMAAAGGAIVVWILYQIYFPGFMGLTRKEKGQERA